MEFHYSELSMPTKHLMPEFPQPFVVKKEAEYELRAGVLADGGDRFGVSSVIFDKHEELIWMGNQGGHVTSYYGPRMQKYTSFQIHASEEVRDILTLEEGIYCLTKSSLRHQIRRGIPRHTYKSPNMEDMQCLFQVDTHKVLMGGHQDKLLELDLNKWVENVINVPEDGCAVLRSGGGSVVACGSANGMITLRDIRCPGSVEQSFRAHTACLSDLDMQGDMLITCGFTQSSATEFADPLPNLPSGSFNDNNFRFSSIPKPPLTTGTKWFSELPPQFYRTTYREPKPIDPEILKTMKMQGPIGYAPNPGTFRRNQMPYVEEDLKTVAQTEASTEAPKPHPNSMAIQPIPKHYLKIDLRFKMPRSHDNIDVLNKAGYPGLEFTLPNSYCNAMLQVLYHIPAVKAILLAHTCAKESCLSCELGFLFRMLDTSGGVPCQADNFLRAFRTVPEAAALGLIMPESGIDNQADLITLIQSWNRFMLQQIHSEILEARKKEKEMTLITQPTSPIKQPANKLVNGQYNEYKYTEIKYMGPPVCDDEALDAVAKNHDEGPIETNHEQPENNDLKNNVSKTDDEESDISKLFAIGRQQVNRCTKCNKEEQRD
ncbi:jg20261 [Pararge aegeria aegeria]|uniref:Jg20261 protein n=1 Tax=Pararge aegeria aegeria TaxID=348720 RepID=A0A8S4R569_9NEOP|nr:jg20261 [Pararge aegeria aegeria]